MKICRIVFKGRIEASGGIRSEDASEMDKTPHKTKKINQVDPASRSSNFLASDLATVAMVPFKDASEL